MSAFSVWSYERLDKLFVNKFGTADWDELAEMFLMEVDEIDFLIHKEPLTVERVAEIIALFETLK